MIESLREWVSVANFFLLFGLVVALIRGQQRMSEGKVRIAKGSEERARTALAAILEVCRKMEAYVEESGTHAAYRPTHDDHDDREGTTTP